MMGDLWVYLPTLCWVLSSFQPKTAWSWCPTLPIHLLISLNDFFSVSLDKKKVLKGKRFADVEEVKQKPAEALKGIKIDKLRNYFE